MKFISSDGTARILYNFKPSTSSAYYFSVTNYGVTCYSFETQPTGLGHRRIPSQFGYQGWCIRPSNQSAGFEAFLSRDWDFATAMIWDLPCNNVPIPTPNGTPAAGQLAFALEPTRAKMARPGFSVDTATGRQLIIARRLSV
jgi:hypothetical protein